MARITVWPGPGREKPGEKGGLMMVSTGSGRECVFYVWSDYICNKATVNSNDV